MTEELPNTVSLDQEPNVTLDGTSVDHIGRESQVQRNRTDRFLEDRVLMDPLQVFKNDGVHLQDSLNSVGRLQVNVADILVRPLQHVAPEPIKGVPVPSKMTRTRKLPGRSKMTRMRKLPVRSKMTNT